MSITGQCIWIVVLLGLSGFFSGAETALMSLSRAQVKRMSNGTASDKATWALLKNPQRLLAAILVGNLLVAVILTTLCASVLATVLMGTSGDSGLYNEWLVPVLRKLGVQLTENGWSKLAEITGMIVNVVLLTPALIVFGELSPKTLAFGHNQSYARFVAFPLLYFERLLRPILWILQGITVFLQWIAGVKLEGNAWSMLSPDEVAATLAASEAGGVTNAHERELLERIMRFGLISASEIMVPRTEISGVSDTLTVEEAFRSIQRSAHHFLPVYHEDFDDIWGIIAFAEYPTWQNSAVKDEALAEFRSLLQQNPVAGNIPVHPVVFVPQSAKIDTLLADMRKNSNHFAVVVGEYGETLGIVTISAILEEIIGRFASHSGNLNQIHPDPRGGWIVDGRARLRILGEDIGYEFLCDVDTIGGLVMQNLGRIPVKGDRVTYNGLVLEVLQMADNRAGAVRIVPLPQDEMSGGDE